MDEVLHCEDHEWHDSRWSIVSSNHREPICLACLLQLLQNPQIFVLKKKMILSELLGLFCQQFGDIHLVLQENHEVQLHFVLTLLDLTDSDDSTFVSMALEACLKLVLQMKSDYLLVCVLEKLSEECCGKPVFQQCQPYLILLGRLLNDIPGLAEKLVHEHGVLLRELGNNLLCPVEETLSALVYIFIFIFHEDLQPLLSPRLYYQVHHSLITNLITAQSQELLINLIGLLQRNLINGVYADSLLSLTVNGKSLVTGVKKLLLSGSDVLQMSGVQTCSLILSNGEHGVRLLEADLAEILFELLNNNDDQQVERVFICLGKLIEVEEFFTRCHTVYGITSVLRAVNHFTDSKNNAPLKEGLQVLSNILERQPPTISLFSKPTDVKSCLVTIATAMGKPDRQVVLLSLQTLKAFLRVNHMGSCVPLVDIARTLQLAGTRTREIIRQKHHLSTSRKTTKKPTEEKPDIYHQVLNNLLLCVSQSVRLIEHCENDPSAFEETFCPPNLPMETNSLSTFIIDVLKFCDEHCIPLVMTRWETFCESADVFLYYKMLHDVYSVTPSIITPLFSKLISAGFLTSALDVRSQNRCDEGYEKCVDDVLVDILVTMAVEMSSLPIDKETLGTIIREGLQHLTCSLNESVRYLQQDDISMPVCYVCLEIIYFSIRQEDMYLSCADVQSILTSSLHQHTDLSEWPPLTTTYITYLISWCFNQTEFDISLHCRAGFLSLLHCLSCSPLHTWYTDPIIQFRWCFSNQQLAHLSGLPVLEKWLRDNPCLTDDENLSETVNEPREITDRQTSIFSTMMTNPIFRNSVQTLLLSCVCESTSETLAQYIISTLTQIAVNEEVVSWVSDCLPKLLQSIFLNKETINYNSVVILLRIMLAIKDTQQWEFRNLQIIYHVVNQLTKTPCIPEAVQDVCLLYISSSLSTTDKTVSNLLLQRADFLSLLQEGIHKSQYIIWDIIAKLILACETTVKPAKSLKVNLDDLLVILNSTTPSLLLSAVKVLSSVLEKDCKCSLIDLVSSSGPFHVRQCRVLWIYCQQFIVQENSELQEEAANCMYHLIQFLKKGNPSLGRRLLCQPWNRPLIEFLLEEFDGIHMKPATVQLLLTFLQDKVGGEVLDFSHLERIHEYLLTVPDNSGKQISRLKQFVFKNMDQKKDKKKRLT